MQPDILVTAPLPPFLYDPLKADYRCHDYYQSSQKPGLLSADFFFIHAATNEIYTLSLHDALPISTWHTQRVGGCLAGGGSFRPASRRSEEHTSELQSPVQIVCRLLLEKNTVTLTSSEGLDNLWAILDTEGRRYLAVTPAFVPHRRIAEHADALGLRKTIVTPPADAGLVASLIEYFAERHHT